MEESKAGGGSFAVNFACRGPSPHPDITSRRGGVCDIYFILYYYSSLVYDRSSSDPFYRGRELIKEGKNDFISRKGLA